MIRRVVAAVSAMVLWSAAFAAAAPKPNLVLITLDSVRADRVGFLGFKNTATPNLDRLAKVRLIFEHAYAQSPSTVVSHASILTGAYPQTTGINEIDGSLSASLPYLPELLRAQGYLTAAFVGSIELDPRNGLAQGFDRGFEKYDAEFRPIIPGDSRPPITERRPDQVAARAIAWLDRGKQEPFFLWVHLKSVRESESESEAESKSKTSYNAAVTSIDAALGKLIGALQRRKVYGTTAIVVAGDHGESLGAHGEDTHGIFLYEETIHVPLLVKLPEGQVAPKVSLERVASKVRLVDVAPTMLEIAAVAVPSQMQGQSLLRVAKAGASSSDLPVYSRSDLPHLGFGWSALETWRAGKYLYIRAPKPELYDLTADPGTIHNLAQSSKAIMDTMASQLENFDRHLAGSSAKASSGLSTSEMQKLASLGYVGLQKSSHDASEVTGVDPKDTIATADRVIAASPWTDSHPDRAVAALEPLVSADPNHYLAQVNLGVALARKGKYAEAVKRLHKAIELRPDSAWAHYEIGVTLLKTGDFKTAAVHLEIATAHLPAFSPANQALAEGYERLGRMEDAKRERQKSERK